MGNAEALVFNDIRFDVIDRDGQPWIKASQLAAALGYAREDKIAQLYQRNADEFTENMTQVIEIVDNLTLGHGNLVNKIRIFSLRGCHLLAMFARTPIGKSFRVWVLNVLEAWNRAGQSVTNYPAPTEADELERHFAVIKGHLRAIAEEEREIFRIVKDGMRPALLAVNTPRRAVAIQSHTAMERLFYSLDYGLEAAEATVRSALIASRM